MKFPYHIKGKTYKSFHPVLFKVKKCETVNDVNEYRTVSICPPQLPKQLSEKVSQYRLLYRFRGQLLLYLYYRVVKECKKIMVDEPHVLNRF